MCIAPPAHADKWALLIGIDRYEDKAHIQNLSAAGADARELKRALVDAAGFPADHVHVLVSDPEPGSDESFAKGDAILRELDLLAREVQPGDTVLVLYSGHGIETGHKAYLLPYDTKVIETKAVDDTTRAETTTDTAISTDEIKDKLSKLRAGTLIMAYDMCRTDPFKGDKGALGANLLTALQVNSLRPVLAPTVNASGKAVPPSVVSLFACNRDQCSYEWRDQGRGYFSYYLEQGLRGEAADESGTVRLDPLMRYVHENVEKSVMREEGGKLQSPYVDVVTGDVGDLVLSSGVHPFHATELPKPVNQTDVVTTADVWVYREPEDALVTVDGKVLPGLHAFVDLGPEKSKDVMIHVEAPGYAPQDRQVKLTRGGFKNESQDFFLKRDLTTPIADVSTAPRSANETGGDLDLTSMLRQNPDSQGLATFKHEDNGETLTVKINVLPADPRRIRAGHRTSALRSGGSYEIRFRARASSDRPMTVTAEAADGDGANIGLQKTVQLTTEFKDFVIPFRPGRVTGRGCVAPTFALGEKTGTIQISHLVLVTLEN